MLQKVRRYGFKREKGYIYVSLIIFFQINKHILSVSNLKAFKTLFGALGLVR